MMGDLSFVAVAPEVAITSAVVLLLMVEVSMHPRPWVWGLVAGAGAASATALAGWQWYWLSQAGNDAGTSFHGMIALDGFGALAGLVMFPLVGFGLMGSWRLAVKQGRRGAEFITLALLAAAGGHLMAASANLIMLFVSLEVFSISLYVLVGFTRDRVDADEAALKYFLLGAFASAVFLYGVALVFASTGSTSIYGAGGIAAYLRRMALFRPALLLVGIALLLVGLAFKVSAAPFHVWAPDVYQGAPSGITGFVAAAAKVAGFAALARVLIAGLGWQINDWAPAVAAIAAVSAVVGTLFAIVQEDVKRMLAYSSVAHAGFILSAFLVAMDADGVLNVGDATGAMWFYVATYAIQVMGAFTVVAVVAGDAEGRAPLDRFNGLGRRSPWLAAAMTFMLLAMAGIPVTAGFVGKVAVFSIAVEAGYLWLVIVALVVTVAGLFFYLRVIVRMYMEEPDGEPEVARAGLGAQAVLVLASAATLVLGVYPWPLLRVLRGDATLLVEALRRAVL